MRNSENHIKDEKHEMTNLLRDMNKYEKQMQKKMKNKWTNREHNLNCVYLRRFTKFVFSSLK
jgi:hypothetical protein